MLRQECDHSKKMFKQLGCKLEKQTQTVNFWFSQGNFRVNLHFPVIKQRVMDIFMQSNLNR